MNDPEKWKQKMTLHLNGGSKFSELHFKLLYDGEETGITRHTRTNGSPKYLKTADELHDGDDTFDILATKGIGLMEWLDARWPRKTKAVVSAEESGSSA